MPRPAPVRVKVDEQSLQVLKRLMGYVIHSYKGTCLLVLILIVISSLATVISSLFIKSLIDDYIIPLLGQSDPSFQPLLYHRER